MVSGFAGVRSSREVGRGKSVLDSLAQDKVVLDEAGLEEVVLAAVLEAAL